jgi:hypothetical protein
MTHSLFVFTKGFLDTRCKIDHPALDAAMVHGVAAFLHELFQVTIAQ